MTEQTPDDRDDFMTPQDVAQIIQDEVSREEIQRRAFVIQTIMPPFNEALLNLARSGQIRNQSDPIQVQVQLSTEYELLAKCENTLRQMLSMKKWRLDTFEYVKVGFKLNLTIVSIEDHFLP